MHYGSVAVGVAAGPPRQWQPEPPWLLVPQAACCVASPRQGSLRHYELARLLSNTEKLPLPILGQYVPFLEQIWSVGWSPPVPRIAFRLFVASLQSTSFIVSPAEGEGAPGSSGPVHLGGTSSGPRGGLDDYGTAQMARPPTGTTSHYAPSTSRAAGASASSAPCKPEASSAGAANTQRRPRLAAGAKNGRDLSGPIPGEPRVRLPESPRSGAGAGPGFGIAGGSGGDRDPGACDAASAIAISFQVPATTRPSLLHAHWHLVTAQRSWILTGRLLECQHGVSLPNPTQLTFQPRWTQEAPEGSRFESDGGQPMLRMLGGRPHGVPSAMTPTLPCAPTDAGPLLTAA